MKQKLPAVSMFLLIALVLSLVPAVALPSRASAAQACTDLAQFVTDVTVPDGTRYDAGATFTKTWRLRNVGTCTWTTAYTMVFDSGTQMGSTTSVNHPANTPPGATVDVSVNMTAPNTAGRYRGYWKFKNANGVIFGLGVNAKPWWVDINVAGTPAGAVVYDFTTNAGSAAWSSAAGGLTFPGTDGDSRGFALPGTNATYEDNTKPQSSILVGPQNVPNGYIQAIYPAFRVETGDIFKTQAGCELQATSCYVQFSLGYQIGTDPKITTIWRFNEKWDARIRPADFVYPDIRLDNPSFGLVGKDVKFVLTVSALSSPTGDRALWGNPVIVRAGASPVTPTPTATGTPPTPTPTSTGGPIVTVPPNGCDRVAFVQDVTIPDGTVMAPGATFRKTWRLKNAGTCTWTTAYQMVFANGSQMGGPNAVQFTQNVAPGQTFDFSVDLTAPSTPGSYRGNWLFKNASGALFGLGSQNKPWFVDIRVSGTATVTPGTVTPSPGVAYDFAANACAGSWFSRAGSLPCPGTDGSVNGFVLQVPNPKLESGGGATDTRPAILAFPSGPLSGQDGYIQGIFPVFRVQTGDRFRATIGCEYNATSCYVAFRLDYQTGSDPIRTFWGPFLERYERLSYNVDVDLSSLNGKDVKFILTVLSSGANTGDRALWVAPRIDRPGGTSATATSTPTGTTTPSTATPTATGTTAPSTATPTPTGTTSPPTATPTPTGTTSPPTATPTPTGTTSASTATPTPTGTTAPASSLYQNGKYNFKFSLPSGANIVSQTDNSGYVTLPLVTSGTNLLSKYIQINVREGANPCASPAVENPEGSQDVTINNIPFNKQYGQGAAASNRYDWVAFSTIDNNACISLAFVLHSVNPGVYSPPPPMYDKVKESAIIDATMATYSKIRS
jgi:hypothetical protein